MTEKEFLQQVWRPYDSVTLENGIRGRVSNVCFYTRSVRVNMPVGAPEWFKYDMIVEHKTATSGDTTDLGLVEEMRVKLERMKVENENLKTKNAQMREKIKIITGVELVQSVESILSQLNDKKNRIERIEACITKVQDAVEKIDSLCFQE